jgi:hippurate hydrolase
LKGFHNWPQIPVGYVAVRAGAVMARVTPLEITVRGCGGHSSQPQACVDPVLAACHTVVAVNSIISRNIKSSVSYFALFSLCIRLIIQIKLTYLLIF